MYKHLLLFFYPNIIVADYAKDNLPKEIDNALRENKGKSFESEDAYITASIQQAFDRVVNIVQLFSSNPIN